MLGGGGARGAAQVGVLQALFEAGVEAPAAMIAVSVGALNGSCIAAYPSEAGVMMLRELWMSRQALEVFRAHPLGVILSGLRRGQLSALPQDNVRRLVERAQALTGITTFEQMKLPLAIVATDLNAGKPAVFRAGALTPAPQEKRKTRLLAFIGMGRSRQRPGRPVSVHHDEALAEAFDHRPRKPRRR